MFLIKIQDRNNIKVFNYNPSRVCMKGVTREYDFDGAKDGIPNMIPMSFLDIQFANSRNPNLFATGLLTFDENERDEIYDAIGMPDWKSKFWTEESIENALLYPTKEKMERIVAVKDILTIERIRGKLVKLKNTSSRRPIDTVEFIVNSRWEEILRGRRNSNIQISIPEDKESVEKSALAEKNAKLEDELASIKEQLKSLLEAQAANKAEAPSAEISSEPEVRKTTRKTTK